jgi:phenylacetate-CoA ligase
VIFVHERLERLLEQFDREQRLSPDKIRKLQLESLQCLVHHHYTQNPSYKELCDEMDVTPKDIHSLDDLEKLPIIERDFLKTHSFRQGLGGFLSVPHSQLVTYLSSSGSTGKSKRIPVARASQQSIFEVCAKGMWLAGVRGYSKDNGGMIMPIFPHGPWPSAFFVQNGSELIDFSSKSEMSMPFEWHATNIKELQPKYIITSPSFISAMMKELKDKIDFEKLGLDRILIGGEYFNESFRKEIEEQAFTKVIDIYGCAETQVVSVECDALRASGWMHYMAPTDIIEVVQPGTDKVLPRGECGEMVISVLNRQAWPVVRYRMGDIIALHSDPNHICECGSTLPLMSRIQGRADDMLVYGNANIYPEMVFNALGTIDDVSSDKFRFTIVPDEYDPSSYYARLQVELADSKYPENNKPLKQKILEALLQQSNELHHAVTKGRQVPAPTIEVVCPGTLYQQEGKLRRFEDLRYT